MNFIKAVLILSGMIIGVGMFGIPFSFARAGFWLGAVELLFLGVLSAVFHLIYGEIVLKTSEFHRLPGYLKVYLGRTASLISWVSVVFGTSFALLAYLLIGSVFLQNIFGYLGVNSDNFILLLAMVAGGALINIFPLKKEAVLNGIFTALLLVLGVVFIFFLSPQIDASNLRGFNLSEAFAPYGVLLFALAGGAVIPEVATVLERRKNAVRTAIIAGSMLPAVFYFFFAIAVVGVSGIGTSQEALAGLVPFIGPLGLFLGSAVGFLAVFTSFVVLNSNFQSLLTLDLKMSAGFAWLIVSLTPFFLYLADFHNFLSVISVAGAVAVGIDAALTVFCYHRLVLKEKGGVSPFSLLWKFAVYILIAAGIFHQIMFG